MPQAFPTIQAAIDAATFSFTSAPPPGAPAVNSIVVSPGIYFENIDFKGKSICITSTLSTDPSVRAQAAATTIIDGGSKGPAVSSSLGLNVANGITELSFFTIQHGGSLNPAGSLSGRGGIYSLYGIPATVVGNTIVNNNYGGIVIEYTPSAPNGSGYAGVYENTIGQNTCWGILVAGGTVAAQNNEIRGTTAPSGDCSYTVPYVGTTVTTNVSGLAIVKSGGGYSYIGGNTIEDNVGTTVAGAPLMGGGGVLINGGPFTLTGNTVRNNVSPLARGGGIDIEASSGFAITTNLIYGNQAGCGGAGIALNFPNLQVTEVPDPQSSSGYTSLYSTVVANNTVADNTVVADPSCTADAQVMFAPNGLAAPSALLINNIFSSSTVGPAMSCGKQATPSLLNQAVFDHNLLYNAGQAFFGSDCVDEGAIGQLGNIVADPQFVSPVSGQYQLLPPAGPSPGQPSGTLGSPGLDAGNNAALAIEHELVPYIDANGTSCVLLGAANCLDGRCCVAAYYNSFNNDLYGLDILNETRLQNVTGQLDANGNPIDVIDMGAYESQGTSNPANDLSMFAFPSKYPDAAGTGTLAAYVIQNFTLPTITDQYGTYAQFQYTAPAAGTMSFVVDGQPTGTTMPIGVTPDYEIPYLTNGYVSEPACITPGVHVVSSSYQEKPGTPTTGSQAAFIDVAPTPANIALTANPEFTVLGTAVTFSVNAGAFACSTYIPSPLSLIDVNSGAVIGTITIDPKTGLGSFTTTGLHQGFNVLQASYAGNATYVASVSNEVTVTVQAPDSLTVTSSQNPVYAYTPFSLTGQLTPNPTPAPTEFLTFLATTSSNPVQQQIGGGLLTAGGSVTDTISLGAGVYSITANYNGDHDYTAAVSPVIIETVLGNPTSLTVSSGLNPASASQAIPLMAHISSSANVAAGSIAGTISFLANGVTVGSGTIDANGNATASVMLAAGTYSIIASFAGNDSFAASQSLPITEVVNPVSTMTTLTVTPNPAYQGQTVTLTATLAGPPVPTGSVTFLDSGTTLGMAPLNAAGQATFTTTTLAVGTHPLKAVYAAGAVFGGSASPVVQEVVLASGFAIALSPATITLPAGLSKTVAIQLTSLGLFAGPLTLSYGPLPQHATATIAPATVTLTVGGTGTSTLTLNTLQRAALTVPPRPGAAHWPQVMVAGALLLLPFAARRRRRLVQALGGLILAAMLQAVSGCTNAYTVASEVAPGTYPIAVTATDANGKTQSATLSVAVTP